MRRSASLLGKLALANTHTSKRTQTERRTERVGSESEGSDGSVMAGLMSSADTVDESLDTVDAGRALC